MLYKKRTNRPTNFVKLPGGHSNRLLKVVDLKVYGSRVLVILDSGEVKNIISVNMAKELYLTMTYTSKGIMVANLVRCATVGYVKLFPVAFADIPIYIDVIIVDELPFDFIIGTPYMGNLSVDIDLSDQTFHLQIGSCTMKLPLEPGFW